MSVTGSGWVQVDYAAGTLTIASQKEKNELGKFVEIHKKFKKTPLYCLINDTFLMIMNFELLML